MVFKNYYKLLGLETSNVTIEEVKAAYRKQAKKYHPDLNVGKIINEDIIKDINEAYKILSEPTAKRKYDRTWNAYMRRNKKAFNDKNRMFKIFLGNFEGMKVESETSEIAKKGENIETEINVGLLEAFYGKEKTIVLSNIEEKAKNITIKIPKGIKNGEKVRIIGQGKSGQNGGNPGDLIIKINIEDDKNFKLKGNDLYTDLIIEPWEAALGSRVTVKAIDTETKIYIPKGIQSGEKLKIPNKGYFKDEEHRGDLVAEVKVSVPKSLTKEEEKIYERLKSLHKKY